MENLPYPFKTKPYHHQFEAWDISKDKEAFALFMDMGTGKTKVTIDNAAYLYDNGKIDGLLVIAPKGCYRGWSHPERGEVVTHLPEHIKYYMAYWSAYKTKAKLKTYQPLFWESDDLHILVMNVESIATTDGYDLSLKFLRTHHALMCVDESTTIKNPKAKRTKAIMALAKHAKYRRILSGMPVTQSPMDLYSQCCFLSPHLLGFSSFFAFRNRYALTQKMQFGARAFDKVVGYQRLPELTEKLKRFSYRANKADCLDLPEKIYMYREVEMTKEQELLYSEMKNKALVMLDNHLMTASMVMTQHQKMHEIVCGFISDPDSDRTYTIPNNRLSELMSVLEEVSGKVIIWACYRHDIRLIYSTLVAEYGEDCVRAYYGDTNDEEREETKFKFQDPNDPLRFMIINPATGKFGMTLTEAKTMIYYSNDYDLEKRMQSEDRAHRIGQTEHVVIVDLVSRKTVDEKIIETLKGKKNVSDIIMDEAGLRAWLQ